MLFITRVALSVLLVLVTVAVVILWLSNDMVGGVIGGVISGAATVVILLPDKERAAWIWSGALSFVLVAVTIFMTLAFSGAFGNVRIVDSRTLWVLALQWAWVLLALSLLLIVIPLRDRQVVKDAIACRQARAAAEAEKARLEGEANQRENDDEQRRRELEYAAQIERVRRAQDRATRPGALTGYEPKRLADVVLERPARMFGSPGAGLGGSGFDARSVKRGQDGEVNFAKGLQKDGLLARFASYWSVHVPDAALGASIETQADVDCVLVSGSTVWLLDMKNYQQGDVVWRVEEHSPSGSHLLSATDAVTGGYVGQPRPMSVNMSLATEAFRSRLSRSGLRFDLRPVVVMMPQGDGLGTIEDIVYPGGVPAVGLPTLLEWLSNEADYDERAEDSVILHAILSQLLKDETGSAIMIDPQTGRRMTAQPGGSTTSFE
ncbi:hypothetical protein [Microbacterium sp. ZW T5_56]|uniref:hypothetical protein n=1 Tax=Microbacterium sp. ZW T5_56 TaxID=3378081 RepID=UPI0038538F9E